MEKIGNEKKSENGNLQKLNLSLKHLPYYQAAIESNGRRVRGSSFKSENRLGFCM